MVAETSEFAISNEYVIASSCDGTIPTMPFLTQCSVSTDAKIFQTRCPVIANSVPNFLSPPALLQGENSGYVIANKSFVAVLALAGCSKPGSLLLLTVFRILYPLPVLLQGENSGYIIANTSFVSEPCD